MDRSSAFAVAEDYPDRAPRSALRKGLRYAGNALAGRKDGMYPHIKRLPRPEAAEARQLFQKLAPRYSCQPRTTGCDIAPPVAQFRHQTSNLSFTGEAMPPKIRPDVTVQKVGDESLVLDMASEQIHQLNATAAWILSQCDGNTSIESICDGFADYFAVDAETAAHDVATTIEALHRITVIDLD
jgi:hypothetical protein